MCTVTKLGLQRHVPHVTVVQDTFVRQQRCRREDNIKTVFLVLGVKVPSPMCKPWSFTIRNERTLGILLNFDFPSYFVTWFFSKRNKAVLLGTTLARTGIQLFTLYVSYNIFPHLLIIVSYHLIFKERWTIRLVQMFNFISLLFIQFCYIWKLCVGTELIHFYESRKWIFFPCCLLYLVVLLQLLHYAGTHSVSFCLPYVARVFWRPSAEKNMRI